MEGYRVFRKDRHRRQGGDVTLYVSDCLECTELCLTMKEEPTEKLLKLQGRAETGHVILGVCYRLPAQEDRAMKSSIDIQEQPHTLKPWSSWGTSIIPTSVRGKTQQSIINPGPGGAWNVMVVILSFPELEKPTRRGAMLGLLLTKMLGLLWNMKLKGSLGCSDHEMVEFKILRAAKVHSKLTVLDFRRAVWPSQGSAWWRGPRKPINIEGSPPPGSGVTHAYQRKLGKTPAICMAEQGTHGQT